MHDGIDLSDPEPVTLARERFAPRDPRQAQEPTPLLIAHGLFGAGRNWRALARAFAERRPVITVDMRNHGTSPWRWRHDYPALAADLAKVLEAEGAPADLLGHSMGGKAAMWLALTRPETVARLIVADIAPVSYGHGERHAEIVAALQGLALEGLTSRRAADARLATRLPDPALRAFLLQSLEMENGRPRWRLNLDALAKALPALTAWPDHAGLKPFTKPTLFLAGARSDYIRLEHEPLIRRLFPRAEIFRLPEAGHWLHAERPREFMAVVERFLSETTPG